MSKGSSRRPSSVSAGEYERRWEETFTPKCNERAGRVLSKDQAAMFDNVGAVVDKFVGSDEDEEAPIYLTPHERAAVQEEMNQHASRLVDKLGRLEIQARGKDRRRR